MGDEVDVVVVLGDLVDGCYCGFYLNWIWGCSGI